MIKTKIITPEDEYQIVLASLQNPREFRFLYDLHYNAIFRFVQSKIGEVNTTADIVSNVFYNALRKLESFKFKGHSIKSWLYRIAYNEVMQHYREADKHRMVSLESEQIQTLADDSEEPELLNTSILTAGLDQLNEEELQLIEMKYFEKLSHREIGEILEITEGNAKVKTHRALKKLKELINKK